MTESLFRILEIVGILLPLTGIFIQVSFRLDDEVVEDTEGNQIELFRFLLVSAGLSLGIVGTLVAGVLAVLLAGFWARLTLAILYIAFLFITIGIGLLWVWAHPTVSLSTDQQTLSESTDNDSDTE